MISYNAYKVVHLLSIILTFSILGGLALHAANGGSRDTNRARKLTGILHGAGLLLILVSGFGVLARLALPGGFPGWVMAKLVLWLLVGASAVLFKRGPGVGKNLIWLLPLLGGVGAWLAVVKPF